MAETKKISRQAQYLAAYHEAQLERERKRQFLGSVKFAIDILCYEQTTACRRDDGDAEGQLTVSSDTKLVLGR